MYLTYEEYTSMGGTLDETAFQDLAFEAGTVIDWYTFNRLQKFDELPEAVGRCCYRLISILQQKQLASNVGGDVSASADSTSSAAVASYSNDGVAVSFNTLSARDTLDIADSQLKSCVQMYLNTVVDGLGRRVLYRGIYPNE